MTTQNTQALVTDAERAEFESIFPTPSACIWHGNGYAATGYNAWDAHKHIERWNGWRSARQSSAQSDASPESEEPQKTKAQLAQAEQEITAYDMTMNRQSKLIAELEAQLEAVGAGGVEALISNAERKSAATLEPFGYFKAEPFGWTDCSDADEGAIALYEAPQPQQVAEPAQVTVEMIADILGTGSEARKNHATLIRCIENAIRRSDCLSRIERGFFMVPTDEDEDEEPGEECLLNWGQSPDDYEKQFGKALDAIIAARGTAQVQAMLAAAPAPPKAETPLTGNEEVDRIIARLDSSDPDFDDCAEAVALFIKMVEESKGPDGFASWKDAAIAARISASPAVVDQPPVAVVDEDEDGLFADFETEIGVVVKRGDKLYAAPQPPAKVKDAWQTIETAPKDGTEILLRSAKGRIANGMWSAANERSGFWAWAYVHQEPVEWMPLPSAQAQTMLAAAPQPQQVAEPASR